MTDNLTQLTRLRARMLATAYSNADFWTQRTAFLTDQAVVALARRDRAAAEALAASLLAPEFIDDTQVLGAAQEAGIDTSTWEARREKIRAYAREAYELPSKSDPATEARRIWASHTAYRDRPGMKRCRTFSHAAREAHSRSWPHRTGAKYGHSGDSDERRPVGGHRKHRREVRDF